MKPIFQLYSRPGCHLCERLLEDMMPLVRGKADVEVVNIDEDSELRQRFDIRVPVLAFAGRTICEAQLDKTAVQAVLAGISAET